MDWLTKFKYRCSVCCRIFEQFVVFEGHFEFFRHCREKIGSYIECYACKRNFHNLAALKYHLQSQEKDFCVCYEIKEKTDSNYVNTIDENISSVLNDGEKTAGSYVLPKTVSSYVPEDKSKRSTNLSLRGRCRLCRANFAQYSTLRKHMTVYCYGTKECDICKYKFTKQAFNEHQKTFHPDLIHKCNVCRKSFITKCYLQRHMKVHLNNGDDTSLCSYECYVCKKVFSAFNDVSDHMDNKHVIYEEWIDPATVVLSNWSPEKSREILQNQPLVLVENLKIHQNLSDQYEKRQCSAIAQLHSESCVENNSSDWESIKLEQLDDCTAGMQVNENVPASNEHLTFVDCQNTVDDTQDDHLQLIRDVQEAADSSLVVRVTQTGDKDITGNDVIDLSSESYDDDVVILPQSFFV